MLFLNQFKKLLVSFIRNDFSMEAWNNSPEQTTVNDGESLENSIKNILADKRLDGQDLSDVSAIETIYSTEKAELYKETRDAIKSLATEMLSNWYTVDNANDYEVMIKVLKLAWFNTEKFPYSQVDLEEKYGWYSITYENGEVKIFNWVQLDETIKSDGSVEEAWFFDTTIDSGINNNDISSINIDSIISWDLINRFNDIKNQIWEIPVWFEENMPILGNMDVPEIWKDWKILSERERIEASISDLLEYKSNLENYNNQLTELKTYIDNSKLEEKPEGFEIDKPVKPDNLDWITLEELTSLRSRIDNYNTEVRNELTRLEDQKAQQEKEQRQKEAAEWQALNKAKRFYERVWATSDSIKELQALVWLEGESIDGKFWPQTFRAIRDKQTELWITSDGMAWKTTLEKLNVEKTVQDFYSFDSQKQEESLVDSAWETISEWFSSAADAVSEWFKTVKEWISEVFNTNKDLLTIKWANWKEITLEFEEWDENNPAQVHVDTPFFDWVSDFPLTNLPDNLSSYEDALTYVQAKVESIKQEYDNQYLDNAINMVSSGRWYSYSVWSFETKDWNNLDVNLIQDTDHDNNFKWVYVEVNTPVWDDIWDSDTRIDLLDSNGWELTREQVMQAVDQAKVKYEEKYKEVQEKQKNENND